MQALRNTLGALVMLTALSWPTASFAQVSYDSATLSGSIFDPAGLPVSGAIITATVSATGAMRTAKSADAGDYRLAELPPGTYKATVEAPGFKKSVVENLILTVGQAVNFDIRLAIGPISDVILVTDVPPLVDPEQTQQANTVNRLQVENLPNIARRATDLIYTVPGVSASNAAVVQDPSLGTGLLSSGFSIGGSNGRNNLITIDGGENDYGSGAPRVRNVPLDSVQEFQINRNAFAAEFGNTIGAAINFITRTGTNKLHGSAAAYFHNERLDSVNYFDKLINPRSRPFEQSVISSGTLGGPVKRDKLFFFTAFEHQKLDSSTTRNYSGTDSFQPISSQVNGYSGGKCPGQAQQQVSQLCYLTQLANSGGPLAPIGAAFLASPVFGQPFADPILKALVQPNEGTFNGIISPFAAVRGIPGYNTPRALYSNWVSKVDYQPGSKDSVVFRFSLMNERDRVAPQPPASTYDRRTDYTLTSAWTHTFSPTLVNIFRAQGVPQNKAFADTPRHGGAEIDIQTGSPLVFGTPFAMPYDATMKRFQFDEGLLWQKRTHTVKYGGTYRPNNYKIDEQLWFGGQWQFANGAIPMIALAPPEIQSALAAYNLSQGYAVGGPSSTNLTGVQSFLAGTPVSLVQADPKSNSVWKAWDHSLGFYVQDSWRVSRKLTLNYGARLDYFRPPSPIPTSLFIAPRIGLAWDPMGNGKTVVRAGGGLFVSPVMFAVPFFLNMIGTSGHYINQGALSAGLPSPPFPSIFAAWGLARSKATTAIPNPTLTPADMAALGWTISPPGPTAFGSIFSTLAPNFKPQYSIQSSASVAQELTSSMSLEIGYNFYRSVHIEQVAEGNFQRTPCNVANPAQFTSAIDPFVGPCYAARPGVTAGVPNSLIVQNDVYSSIGSSVYHGLTASFTRRFSRNLQFQANYTLSHAADNTSDYSTLSVPFRPDELKRDWSTSSFNVAHNFVANSIYTTPFRADGKGWSKPFADVSISNIVSARSGIPFTLLVPGLGGGTANGTLGHTSEARPWNEPRNEGRGASFASWDLRVSRSFSLNKEKGARADVIVQFQNLLNRTNFAAVNNNFPADPSYALPNGGNLLNGPYNLKGFAPASVAQLSQPLAFSSAYAPRQISFGLKIGF
ncbi:MAG: carboxypeptidase regulatory-like domain-containing protein [Acidobacteriota bacterium]